MGAAESTRFLALNDELLKLTFLTLLPFRTVLRLKLLLRIQATSAAVNAVDVDCKCLNLSNVETLALLTPSGTCKFIIGLK